MAGVGSKPGERRGGRQKGVPNKATASVKALAGKYGPKAIEQLALLITTAESEAARVAACKEILDRAYGKAATTIAGDPENPLNLIQQIKLVGIEPDANR